MPQQILKEKILDVIEGSQQPKTGALATVNERGRPCVRIMTFKHEGLTLYSVTSLKSKKVAHMRNNPFVSIEMSRNIMRLDSDYIVVEAKAEIITDNKVKKHFWDETLSVYFSGPEDPDYCILKFTPETIDYMGLETLAC